MIGFTYGKNYLPNVSVQAHFGLKALLFWSILFPDSLLPPPPSLNTLFRTYWIMVQREKRGNCSLVNSYFIFKPEVQIPYLQSMMKFDMIASDSLEIADLSSGKMRDRSKLSTGCLLGITQCMTIPWVISSECHHLAGQARIRDDKCTAHVPLLTWTAPWQTLLIDHGPFLLISHETLGSFPMQHFNSH